MFIIVKIIIKIVMTASLFLANYSDVALGYPIMETYPTSTPTSEISTTSVSAQNPIPTTKESSSPKSISYNEFLIMVKNNTVAEAALNLNHATFSFKTTSNEIFTTDNPKTENFKEFLLLHDIRVKEDSTAPKTSTEGFTDTFTTILAYSILLSILGASVLYNFKKAKQLERGSASKEKASEKENTSIPKTTFNDIQGCKELKKDMQFIIEFLKNPTKYESMGARMPKGIILYGPPGTGKTLTAKAIAGTAGVPFINISGSDFVQMYVGVGAKKVRELYKEAKEKAPCIVFIDEIDAVGGKRGRDENTERDQTINALLTELSGFSSSDSVITICATNRIDMLDEALIRPGRFDKHLAIPLPEREDRLAILQLHGSNKKFSEDIDLNEVAKMTVGFSGAALESLLNEAAFIAVNKNKDCIDKEDLDTSFYKQVMQGDKKEDLSGRDIEELTLVAYHEAGHALVTKLLTDDEVSKVTVIPSTSGAGGVTFRTPKSMGLHSKRYLKNLIQVLYAGRAAEYLLLNDEEDITTGASKDIEQASQYIKEYISAYGMSEEYGMINLRVFSNYDESKLIKQASILAKNLYKEVETLLKKNKELLVTIADALIEKETLNSVDLDTIIAESLPSYAL